MQVTFLDGEVVNVSGLRVGELPSSLAIEIVKVNGSEVEIFGGPSDAADEYFSSTGTKLSESFLLRSGQTLALGAMGGIEGGSRGFRLDVDGYSLFGQMPPVVSADDIANAIADAKVEATDRGVTLRGLERAKDREPSILQVVPDDFLLAIRRVEGRREPVQPNAEGGRLFQSDPERGPIHLILETERYLAYFHPVPAGGPNEGRGNGTSLERAAAAASQVKIELAG